MMKARADDIRRSVRNRGIECLLHFTQLLNLEPIIEHGFLPRSMIVGRDDVTAHVLDADRLDGQDDAISVSISAFNHAMFSAKRQWSNGLPWILLALDPSILWTHPCRFHAINAASREARRRQGGRDHIWAFQEMFSETQYGTTGSFKGSRWREETGIPDHLTTFPDAEVQVMAPFSSELITDAWIDCEDLVDPVRKLLDRMPSEPRPLRVGDFAPRFSNGHASWG